MKYFVLALSLVTVSFSTNTLAITTATELAPVIKQCCFYLVPKMPAGILGDNLENAQIMLNGSLITPYMQTQHEIRFITPNLPNREEYRLEISNSGGSDTAQILIEARRSPESHTFYCQLKTDTKGVTTGKISCKGNNEWGQLGNNTRINSIYPVTVKNINTAIAVSTGYNHACAILANGTVQCWGGNDFGQLGHNERDYIKRLAVTVVGINNAVAISAGLMESCAVLADGTVSCWGWNLDGKLGNKSTDEYNLGPVKVRGITNAAAVDVGNYHNCAVLSTGQIKCWGANRYGQLGNKLTVPSPIPVSVGGIRNAISVSAGPGHTCAVLTNAAVKCWGVNKNGELGNGTYTNSLTPVIASFLGKEAITAVQADSFYSCALTSQDKVMCWGVTGYRHEGSWLGH